MPYADPERKRANKRAYRVAHREEIRAQKKAHYGAHRAEVKGWQKAYGVAHREERKAYRVAHREEIRAWKKAYRVAHRDEIREQRKAYDATHREKLREQRKAYDATHRDEIREQRKAYDATHREEHRAQNKACYARRQEAYGARVKAWRRAHPDKVKAIKHRRRARKLAASGSWSAKDLHTLREILGSRCLRPGCTTPEDRIAIDHIIPLARGGSNHPTNLQPLCVHCNCAKHTEAKDYRTKEQRQKVFQAFQLRLF